MEEHSVIENFEMKLNESAKDFLKETAKWAYFLSILGYIGIGFIIFAALFAGTLFSTMGKMNPAMGAMGSSFGMIMAVVYLLIAALYFFPVYYLNKFASNAKAAFKNNDAETLTTSLRYLKSHYKFIGIMTLVIFSLYLLMFVGMIISGIAFSA
ncbi:DUF5362 family protein [Flavobacterium sp. KS-LB2]|jgi:hypothetical protein|uniref:DUF5362 family protein n=1 Tax=Flavobacterium sp. KS-LB2 TaxID=3120525 RepID=UPI0030D56AF3